MDFEHLQNEYTPDKKHRRSIRYKGYDYSTYGYYFIIICTQDKKPLLGQILDGKTILNAAGKMVEKWYCKILPKFEYAKIDKFVIMPNHTHAIIQILDPAAAHSLCPEMNTELCDDNDQQNLAEQQNGGEPLSLKTVVQWFKTMTTNEYIKGVKNHNWPTFRKRLWQRNYYEHIIREGKDLSKIREYIQTNPEDLGTYIILDI